MGDIYLMFMIVIVLQAIDIAINLLNRREILKG